jgi:hypothetical protein
MHRYAVFSAGKLVGHSALEGGDPPMGVAIGRFFPQPEYERVKAAVVAAFDSSQDHLHLSIVDTESGSPLPAEGGIQVLDASDDIGPEAMQVHVLGIAYPLYEQLFPGRHAAYVAGFTKAR